MSSKDKTEPAPRRTRRLHVGCLEGYWDPALTDRQSVLPVLELLETQEWVKYYHRRVGSKPQLLEDLDRAMQKRYQAYDTLYLGFHGLPGALYVGRDEVTLSEIAGALGPRCQGRVVHFASCGTGRPLKRLVTDLEAFRKQTKAKAVCAFTRNVDWIESAAFEILLFSWLASYGTQKSGWALRQVKKQYPDLVRILGFEVTPKGR